MVRWVVLAAVMAVAGCAGGDTPYMARLRAQCAAGDKIGCESLASLEAEARNPRPASAAAASDRRAAGRFLLDTALDGLSFVR